MIGLTRRGMLHDPERYPSPDEFIPERYLEQRYGLRKGNGLGVKDQAIMQDMDFGFGRRKCPGIHIASNSIVS